MFSVVEAKLLSLINTLPLEALAFVGSFIEEVLAPVPSVAVMLMTGSFAAIQERPIEGLLLLAVIAALGKTIGAIIVYFLTAKIGDVILRKFGWFFKVSPEDIEALSKKVTGGPRDYLIFTIFRALPVVPSSVVSLGCGLLKIPFTMYLVTTFIGTIVRDAVFLYAGYRGTTVLTDLANESANIESYVQMALLAIIVAVFGYVYYRRSRSEAKKSN